MGFFESFKKKGDITDTASIGSLADIPMPTPNTENQKKKGISMPPPPLPARHEDIQKDIIFPKAEDAKDTAKKTDLPLPLPPIPQQAAQTEKKNIEEIQPPPLPPANIIDKKDTPEIKKDAAAAPIMKKTAIPANTYILKEEPIKLTDVAGSKRTTAPGRLPDKLGFIGAEIPEMLPVLPSVKKEKPIHPAAKKFPAKMNKIEKIPSFILKEEPVIEEIPVFEFMEPQAREDLPILEIMQSEDEQEDRAFLKNLRHRSVRKPLFVRTDTYSQVQATLDNLKTYIVESGEIIYSLENIKKNSEVEHANYKETLEDIQRKLIYVDKILFEIE